MTVTLKLKPEVEACALEQAAKRGLSVEGFLESLIMIVRRAGKQSRFIRARGRKKGKLCWTSSLIVPHSIKLRRLWMTVARSSTAKGKSDKGYLLYERAARIMQRITL